MNNELLWVGVKGWEDFYQANKLGEIRRHPDANGRGRCIPGKIRKQTMTERGYFQIKLRAPGRTWRGDVHTLIAYTFLGPRPFANWEVNHKNLNKWDNQVSNLEWVSKSGNCLHATEHGATRGENNGRAKVTEEDVLTMRGLREYYGLTIKEIADRFDLSESACWSVLKRKNWPHVH